MMMMMTIIVDCIAKQNLLNKNYIYLLLLQLQLSQNIPVRWLLSDSQGVWSIVLIGRVVDQ